MTGGGGPASTISIPRHMHVPTTNSNIDFVEEEKYYNNAMDNDLLGLGGDSVTPISIINQSDDDTVPSSAAATQEDPHSSATTGAATGTFNMTNTNTMATPLYYQDQVIDEEEERGAPKNPRTKPSLIEGYLQKLGRNGKWQKRYFETDGDSLRYYKSHKRSKLMATLTLNKVGTIAVSTEDPSGTTFHIQVADRPYSLRASSRATCRDWVITLHRIKEARMGLGRLHLAQQLQQQNLIFVQETNRQRTQAIQDSADWEMQLEQNQQPGPQQKVSLDEPNNAKNKPQELPTAYSTANVVSRISLASWHKPQNALYRIKIKMIHWARSIRTCRDPQDQVVLDIHSLDPPIPQYLQHYNVPMTQTTTTQDHPHMRHHHVTTSTTTASKSVNDNNQTNTTSSNASTNTTTTNTATKTAPTTSMEHHHHTHNPLNSIQRTGSKDGSVEFVVSTQEPVQLD
mmetsp:Transcript_3154/g.4621  ORF Transcript_3154/g.4621 Transcript_3154/m.4621 type:complete len:456 (+) Transcript_3154:291-1658(+)|eukprot:CAMPEP_0202459930 /NCGR_PEP_ID=MMETSP1360-20130828/39996_1 /ASSEMBLY_ACC=CAM_ASM_000848 /TAXON_ID=515479 /ORGANISM="Licmophora paradoxa, Strain CCMP2313" /LENGTH=455 /DNA_ID=CAMNT_0049081301 /DNA_START=197 /DNA_END=1564 /DNA_ORIENTATION=+